jgi:hypothetical protein
VRAHVILIILFTRVEQISRMNASLRKIDNIQ